MSYQRWFLDQTFSTWNFQHDLITSHPSTYQYFSQLQPTYIPLGKGPNAWDFSFGFCDWGGRLGFRFALFLLPVDNNNYFISTHYSFLSNDFINTRLTKEITKHATRLGSYAVQITAYITKKVTANVPPSSPRVRGDQLGAARVSSLKRTRRWRRIRRWLLRFAKPLKKRWVYKLIWMGILGVHLRSDCWELVVWHYLKQALFGSSFFGTFGKITECAFTHVS